MTRPTPPPEQSPATGAATPAANACPRRIFLPTADTRLIALNADTGKMCEDFGDKGQVDLGVQHWHLRPRWLLLHLAARHHQRTWWSLAVTSPITSPPTNQAGVIRAFDVHTGKLVWNWDSGNPDEHHADCRRQDLHPQLAQHVVDVRRR
jgi:quinoprotein glucose dehydrogenase